MSTNVRKSAVVKEEAGIYHAAAAGVLMQDVREHVVAKVAEVCKGMLVMAIAWFACQLWVHHSAVLAGWEQKRDYYHRARDPAGEVRSTVVSDWA